LVSFLSFELILNFGQVKMTIGNIDGKAIVILGSRVLGFDSFHCD
jgi:hypothetical protein